MAGEEKTCAHQLVRFAEAVHRRVSPDGLRARGGRAVFVEEQLAVLLGGEEARRECVHAHALRRPLAGEELREAQDRRLGRRVGHDARERQVRGDAGDVDDAAAPALAHRRAEFLTGQQHAAGEIEVEVRLPVGERDLLERALGGDGDLRGVASCGVHENRRRTELGFDLLVRLAE